MTIEAPIAPDLGHLADPAGDGPFDDVRLALLDALVTAKGEGHLEHAIWQGAFEAAARSLRMRVIGDAEEALRSAAAHSRYPRRRLANALPDADGSDLLLQRLLAEGMGLERLEREPDNAGSRRARTLAIVAGWEGALRVAQGDAARWRRKAGELANWRRPVRPFWIGCAALTVLTLIVSGWLGGQLPAPTWFAPIHDTFWRLPWP